MLSVIIATHKRAPILHTCLEHLAAQTAVKQLQVIVVSDGPDEATKAVCTLPWKMSVHYTDIPKAQQGAARNAGVKLAESPYCLFINDDIFLQQHACALHITALEELNKSVESTAVLGFTTWDTALKINTTMKFLERSGWQFGYPKIAQYAHSNIPSHVQHSFTYSSHISIPTSIAVQFPFTVKAHGYGWEDIEWGKRLADAEVRLWYEPDAIGYHHHFLTVHDSLQRLETIGKAAVTMQNDHPHLVLLPTKLKQVVSTVHSWLPTLAGRHRRAYLRGIRLGKREIGK